MQIRTDLDERPVSPDWFAPDYPTLLRFRDRTARATEPVSDAPAGPAG